MLLLLIIVYSVEGVKRSKADCIVCGKISQKDSFRIVRTSDSDVENCFGVKNIELRVNCRYLRMMQKGSSDV